MAATFAQGRQERQLTGLHVSTHPLVRSKLSRLRDERTPPAEFRQLVRMLAVLLGQEATADLALRPSSIRTPLTETVGQELAESVAVVPILRAGLGMADGLLDLIPDACVWHIGLYRDEATLEPNTYYSRLPRRSSATLALLVDPMLATGGSAVHACELLSQSGVRQIRLVTILAAPEGVERMRTAWPDVPIFTGALDSHLNAVGYIVPGLGDAGDRQFATPPDLA
jgi:uracil phosphoribosyltransferase